MLHGQSLPASGRESTEYLEQIAVRIGMFVEGWERAEADGPPDIADYLPDEPQFALAVLIELIKVDLECRWTVFDLPKHLSEYIAEFPQLRNSLPVGLIYEEYRQRNLAGDPVDFASVITAYPDAKSELLQLHELHAPPVTVISRRPKTDFDELSPGDRIGQLDLLMPLGQGAFAKVFLARDRPMNRLVALKISQDHGSEGVTLAQLDHDNIVRVFHQESHPDRSLRLLTMQYLPGGTLAGVVKTVREYQPDGPIRPKGDLLLKTVDDELESRGESRPGNTSLREQLSSMDWAEVVAWLGVQLATGLAYAHSRGVLHRDLKPANVLLSAEGIPKLADFNISFSSESEDRNPTAYFGGSLPYMSLEHLEAFHPDFPRRPDELDARADLFSLGVILWELLHGQRPFEDPPRANRLETLDSLIETRCANVRLQSQGAQFSSAQRSVEHVIRGCLAANREDRWNSAEELLQQLQICLEPKARELINPPHPERTAKVIRRTPIIVLALNLIPNAIAARYNYLFNRDQMDAAVLKTFETVQLVINSIAFPVGIGLILWFAIRAKREALPTRELTPLDAGDERDASCLLLGHRCSMVCLILWTLAGLAYPLSLDLQEASVSRSVYILFFLSLVISGLIATVYPFFGVTWFSLRSLFPANLRKRPGTEGDRRALWKLKIKLRLYLMLAALIPLIGISAVTLVGSELLWLVRFLALGGIAAFAGAYFIEQRLEDDLGALERVLPGRS